MVLNGIQERTPGHVDQGIQGEVGEDRGADHQAHPDALPASACGCEGQARPPEARDEPVRVREHEDRVARPQRGRRELHRLEAEEDEHPQEGVETHRGEEQNTQTHRRGETPGRQYGP